MLQNSRSNMSIEQSHILIACATYFIATASPGPATVSIMEIAANKGRQPALIFAAGVLLGSLAWAILAVLGVATLLSAHANLLYWFKVIGGIYLFWLSYKSVKRIFSTESKHSINSKLVHRKLFLQGLALHLTNPKAIFTWLAIVTLALPDNITYLMSFTIVLACMALGILVFGGYAIIFSTSKAQTVYKNFGKWLDGVAAIIFGAAGYKLLTS